MLAFSIDMVKQGGIEMAVVVLLRLKWEDG